MVSPISQSIAATRLQAATPAARAPSLVLPSIASPVSSQGADHLDLAAQIEDATEQDLDYQILRRAFPLDRAADAGSRVAERPVRTAESPDTDSLERAPASLNQLSLKVSTVEVETAQLTVRVGEGDAVGSSRLEAGERMARLELSMRAEEVNVGDPLVLDLSGEGVRTTGLERGVSFDLTGYGQVEQVSFVTGDTWALALDVNDNGRIDSGRELFGDQNGAAHGFAELARHDDNTDGLIDERDAVFARLKLLQIGADGEQRLRSLSDAGVAAIGLGFEETHKALNLYDRVSQMGSFRREDGSVGEAVDVQLAYQRTA